MGLIPSLSWANVERPQHCVLVFYMIYFIYYFCYLFIIIFQLWDWLPPFFMFFFAAERPRHCALVGLSALAEGPMDSRSCVRSFVRDAISGDPRIRFWWFFAQSYILMSLKKCSKRIFEKNSRFRDFGQKWPIFDIFFKSAHQICLKLCQ